MDKDSKYLVDSLIAKRKPPKLKALDRSISIAIDNYTPTPTMVIDDSLILKESPSPVQLITKPEIYFVGSGSTNAIAYEECPSYLRKSNFRRSDTLDVHSPSNFQMRKTHSFHSNDPTVEELLQSRRTSSVRSSYLFPPAKEVHERSPSPNRRSCRMHRSFNEQKRPVSKHELAVERVKFSSLNDEILQVPDPTIQSFDSTNISIENEIIRSRSNSRSRVEDETFFEDGGNNSIHKHPHKHSSHSLDHQQPHSFKRGGKHTHSLYLSPKSLDELQVHRSLQGTKKSHSSSMRVRPYRESLSATKKSKSFMVDTYPEFELSPHRRDSRILITEDIKRSPRPSAHIMEEKRPSFERKTSLGYDINVLDFDPMLRPFRQGRRKSSLSQSVKKVKKKSLTDEPDDDEESDRKRKRIACIVITVFLCLVCACAFVFIVTLTHSSVVQVQNQSRKTYTFSRDSPIHYNVRQENERLMQESMNRARFAKNFTEPSSLAAAEEIP